MRYGHRRRANGGLTIHFRQVAIDHVRIVRNQELPAHRESGIAFRFRNVGFLQQLQRSATGTDKDKLRLDIMFRFVIFQIGDCDSPAIVGITLKATHFGAQLQRKVGLFLQ